MQHSPQDNLHEMFIVRGKGDYGRPDKHLHTTESHTIVDGAMLIVLFEDDGEIKDVFSSAYSHSSIPLSFITAKCKNITCHWCKSCIY